MLDPQHRDSRRILEAAALLEALRGELAALQRARGSAEVIGRSEQICLVIVPKLRTLAENHFASASSIQDDLTQLLEAVGTLDHATAFTALQRLEGSPERPGFGAWAI